MKIYLKLLITISFTIGFNINLYSQQVIAPSGDTYKNSQNSISWTIGESVIETFSHTDIILTQGFHQTKITVTNISSTENLNFRITVYPNPASDILYVQYDDKSAEFKYSLYNISGEIIKNGIIQDRNTPIDLQNINTGTFFLKIIDNTGITQTFKIIKTK
jgi:hypothetical protein